MSTNLIECVQVTINPNLALAAQPGITIPQSVLSVEAVFNVLADSTNVVIRSEGVENTRVFIRMVFCDISYFSVTLTISWLKKIFVLLIQPEKYKPFFYFSFFYPSNETFS